MSKNKALAIVENHQPSTVNRQPTAGAAEPPHVAFGFPMSPGEEVLDAETKQKHVVSAEGQARLGRLLVLMRDEIEAGAKAWLRVGLYAAAIDRDRLWLEAGFTNKKAFFHKTMNEARSTIYRYMSLIRKFRLAPEGADLALPPLADLDTMKLEQLARLDPEERDDLREKGYFTAIADEDGPVKRFFFRLDASVMVPLEGSDEAFNLNEMTREAVREVVESCIRDRLPRTPPNYEEEMPPASRASNAFSRFSAAFRDHLPSLDELCSLTRRKDAPPTSRKYYAKELRGMANVLREAAGAIERGEKFSVRKKSSQ